MKGKSWFEKDNLWFLGKIRFSVHLVLYIQHHGFCLCCIDIYYLRYNLAMWLLGFFHINRENTILASYFSVGFHQSYLFFSYGRQVKCGILCAISWFDTNITLYLCNYQVALDERRVRRILKSLDNNWCDNILSVFLPLYHAIFTEDQTW